MKITSLLNRKFRDRNRKQQLRQGLRKRLLRCEPLENRLLLSADFNLSGGALMLDNFTQVSGESLSISEDGNNYRFGLSEGTWTGTVQAGVSLDSGGQVLEIEKPLLSAGTIDEVAISDTTNIDFSVTFGDVNMQPLLGTFALNDVGDVAQAAASFVQFSRLHVTAASVTLAESSNDFGSVRATATAGGVKLFDAGDILLGTPGLADTASVTGGNYVVTAEGTITVAADHSIGSVGNSAVNLIAGTNIALAGGSSITTVDGGITLQANQQAIPAAGNFIGIDVIRAAITTTGSGNVELTGRGGDSNGLNYGIQVRDGAKVQSTATGASVGTITLDGTGGDGTSGNSGILIESSGTQVTSVDGDIQITGQGGDGNFDRNIGVSVRNSAVIASTGTGADAASVTLDGNGGNGRDVNEGVEIAVSATVTSVDGDILITGQGGDGSGWVNRGVSVQFAAVMSTGTGADAANITIDGIGGGGTTANDGVRIHNSGTVTSGDGDIRVTGASGAGDGTGIELRAAHSILVTRTATITLIADSMRTDAANAVAAGSSAVTLRQRTNGTAIDLGTKAAGTLGLTNNELNNITAGTLVIGDENTGTITVSQAMQHAGDADLSVVTGRNIVVDSGAGWSTVDGDLTLSANQQTTPSSGDFVGIDIAAATVASTSGAITLSGRGGDSGAGNQNGVAIRSGAVVGAGTTGPVVVQGTGGMGLNNFNSGVHVTGVASQITSGGGDVTVIGTGGGAESSNQNVGVRLESDGAIMAGGTGDVSVVGTGGNTSGTGSSNRGVLTIGTATEISSGGGNVTVTGTGGGAGSSNFNDGIGIGGKVTAGGSGTVSLTGTGGNTTGSGNRGIWLLGWGSFISSSGGDISLAGSGGVGDASFGMQVASRAQILATSGTPTVSLAADSLDVGSGVTIDAGANAVFLRPNSAGTSIDLGGADATGTLGLTDAELDRITAGTLLIGDQNTGAITVSAAIQHAGDANVNLVTGRNIALLSGSSITTVDGDVMLSANMQATPASGDFVGIDINSATVQSTGAGNLSLSGRGGDSEFGRQHGVTVRADGQVQPVETSGSGSVEITGFGGDSTGDVNVGVSLGGVNSRINSGGGRVSVAGTGGGTETSRMNYGVAIFAGAITAGKTGEVAVQGEGGNTVGSDTHFNTGVYLWGVDSQISSNGGDVSVVGMGGGAAAGAFNFGVHLKSGGEVTAGEGGTVVVEGSGGNVLGDGGSNRGVVIEDANSQISSSGGDVQVDGTGGGAGAGTTNTGVYLVFGGEITAGGTGSVTVTGRGGNLNGSGGNNHGISLIRDSRISSSDGSVVVIGTGGGNADSINNDGVMLSEAEVAAGGNGTVTVRGSGGNTAGTGGHNAGVSLSSGSRISSTDADVSIEGTGGGAGTSIGNDGVEIAFHSEVAAGGSGALTVEGFGGNLTGEGGANAGVQVFEHSRITSSGGNVAVIGTGGGAGQSNNNSGTDVSFSGVITAEGNGSVTVTGTGGNTTGSGSANNGVAVARAGRITSSGGSVVVTGTGGGAGTGSSNAGVQVFRGEISAGGVGSLTVRGTGGAASGLSGNSNHGVYIDALGLSDAKIASAGGDVSIVGKAGGAGASQNNYGVYAWRTGEVTAGGTADVRITADSVNLTSDAAIRADANTVILRPQTSGTAVDLGGADATGALGLTDAELDRVTAATLVIGDSSTGAVIVSAMISRSATTNVGLRSGGTIVFDPGSLDTAGGNLLLAPGIGGVRPITSGSDVLAANAAFTSGAELNITFEDTTDDADYSQLNVSGAVDLAGVDLELSGAYVPGNGDTFTIVSATGGVTGQFSGLDDGDEVMFNGQPLTIHYTATAVTLTADLNEPPTANPGGPYAVSEHATVQLDASASSDPEAVGYETTGNLLLNPSGEDETPDPWTLNSLTTLENTSAALAGGSIEATDGDWWFRADRTLTVDNATVAILQSAFASQTIDVRPFTNIQSIVLSADHFGVGEINSGSGLVGMRSLIKLNYLDEDGAFLAVDSIVEFDNDVSAPVTRDDLRLTGTSLPAGTAFVDARFSTDIRLERTAESVTASAILGLDDLSLAITGQVDNSASVLTYEWDLDGDGIFGEAGTDASRGDEVGITPAFFSLGLAPNSAVTVSLLVTDDHGETSQASTTVTVEAADPADLTNVVDNLLASGETEVELSATQTNTADFLQAIADLPPNTGEPIEITLVLERGTIGQGRIISVPEGYTLIVDGANGQTSFVGASPALTVTAGDVIFKNGITLTNTTDAPTILVQGGSLTLRDVLVEESDLYDRAAIEVTGGTVDLGTAANPGGNSFDVRGLGEAIRNSTAFDVPAVGNSFQADAVEFSDPFLIEDEVYHALDDVDLGLVSFIAGNVAPRATIDTVPPSEVTTGEPVAFTGSFADVGSIQTHTAVWTIQSNDTSAADISGVVDEQLGSGSVTGDYTFPAPGIYTITLEVKDEAGLSGIATTTLTVLHATPTLSIDWIGGTYDGSAFAAEGSVTGFDGSDLGAPTFTYFVGLDTEGDVLPSAPVNAGTYTVLAEYDGDTLHHSASATATVTVTARAIEVTADSLTKTYGATDPDFTFQITDGSLAAGDELTGTLSREQGQNVGQYAIARDTLDAGNNYELNYVGAALSITPASLTITAHDHDKVFGQADPELTYEATGFRFDDDVDILTGELTRDAGEDVKLYDIHQGTLAANSNYAIDFLMAQLAITQATPVVAVTGGTFVYDGQPHPATGSVTGVADADLGAPAFTYSYTDEDGTDMILAGAPEEPGVYHVVAAYSGSTNYEAASAATTITIAFEVNTLTDLNKILQSGRTIPIKLQLLDAGGNNVSSSDIDVTAIRLERLNDDETRTEELLASAGNSNSDSLFRYDEEMEGYIFNLSTKGLLAGTYAFTWAASGLGDPIEHELMFTLK